MPKPRPPHLRREKTRHGAVVWYVLKEHGPRTRLSASYGSQEFWTEYRAALEGAPAAAKAAKPKSLQWEIDHYRRSSAWSRLASSTRRQRENILRTVVDTAGTVALGSIDAGAIREGRERRSATPHAANNFLKTMRGLFAWAMEEGFVTIDPTKDISLLTGQNDNIGYHTWIPDEIARYEARWPVGTRERLAFDLLLYTGLRRGDAVRVGRQHVRDGILTIRTEKNDETVFLPILPPLAASIAATKTGDLAFLATDSGRPWVKESFGNWFREACRKASCRGSAHGLRKAGATRAAERGASERELMALFGWTTGKMANHYTRTADRKRLALSAAARLLQGQPENEIARTSEPGAGETPKKQTTSGA